MIIRDLELKVGYTNAVLDKPLHLYMYDRNIKLRITIVNYDFRFGGNLNGNFIGENNIVKAKSFLRSPNGKIFEDPDVETDISNDIVEILIKNIMTDELAEIGEWSIQIKLFDADGSTIHVHPFNFYVHELIGLTGDLNFDARNGTDTYDPKLPDPNIIKSSYLNDIENRLAYVYSSDLIKELNLNGYKTEGKTTKNAINEIKYKFSELANDFTNLVNGTLDIEQYKKDHNLKTDTAPDKIDAGITGIEIINKAYNKIAVGDYRLYKISVEPKSKYSSRYKLIRWKSSNPKIAKVNETGKVTGISEGKAIITAYNRYKETVCDSFEISIGDYIPLTGLNASKPGFDIPLGETVMIPINFIPADTTERSLYWESTNTDVAKVDQLGNVTGDSLGHANIIVTSLDNPKKTLTLQIVVKKEVVKTVKIDPIKYDVYVDDVIDMSCTTYPVGQEVIWECNSEYASITENGTLTVLSEGTFDVKCSLKSDNSISDTIRITSGINYGAKPTRIVLKSIPGNGNKLAVGNDYQVEYTIEPDGSDSRLSWKSSDVKIATVDNNGLLSIIGEGTATITATSVADRGVSISFEIECEVTVSKVTITNPIAELKYGETHPCRVKAEPIMPEDAIVIWSSSDSSIASIDSNGLITFIKPGTVSITASIDGVKDSFVMQCVGKVPTDMTIMNSITEIKVHDSHHFILAFRSGNAADPESTKGVDTRVTWTSSDQTIIEVTSNGLIKALKPGTAEITVQSYLNPTLSRSCKITVNRRKPDKIEIVNKVNTIVIPNPSTHPQHQFDVKYYYELNGTYIESEYCIEGVKWELLGRPALQYGCASIDQNGLLTIKGVGLITVKALLINDTAINNTVEVDAIINEPIKIEVSDTFINARTDEFFALNYTVTPNGYNIPIDITSTGPLNNHASIGYPNLFYIVNPGVYTVTLSTLSRNKIISNVIISVNCYITAMNIKPKDSSVDVSFITDDYIDLSLVYAPSNATLFNFTWESSDESVATIVDGSSTSLTRRIKKVGYGKTTITCKYIPDKSITAKIDLIFTTNIEYKVKVNGDPTFRLNGEIITGTLIGEDSNCNKYYSYKPNDIVTDISFKKNKDLIEVLFLDTSSVIDASDMFMDCTNLERIPELNLRSAIRTGGVFKKIYNNDEEPFKYVDPTKIVTLLGDEFIEFRGMFYNCMQLKSIPNLINTENIIDMHSMFHNCRTLKSIPEMDTSNVVNMGSMFSQCVNLTSIPTLNTSKVLNMGGFSYYSVYEPNKFESATNVYRDFNVKLDYSINSNVSGVTSNTYMTIPTFSGTGGMFGGCVQLKTIPEMDTSNVITMDGMFAGCHSLETIPEMDTSNVITMESIFNECCNLRAVPILNTSKVRNMSYMFSFCWMLQSIPILNTDSVDDVNYMFLFCKSMNGLIEASDYWDRAIEIFKHAGTFTGCKKIVNSIPSDWGWKEVALTDVQLSDAIMYY